MGNFLEGLYVRETRLMVGVLVVLFLSGLAVCCLEGCKKVSDADKTRVAVAVASLKQCSASFSAAASGLVATDQAEQISVAKWAIEFQKSLNAEGTGCAALQDALTKEKTITSQEAEVLKARATDAAMNSVTFRLMISRCTLTEAQRPWAASTQATLNDISTQLLTISNSISASSTSATATGTSTVTGTGTAVAK